MSQLIIIAAAFVGAACLFAAVASMFRNDQATAAESRLAVLAGAASSKKGGGDDKNILSEPLDERESFAEILVNRVLNLRRFLDQADASVPPSKFLMICGGLGLGGAVIWLFVGIAPYAAPAIGLMLSFIPFVWLIIKRKHRLAMFQKQLPEALELVSRALRSGHSLASGLNLVAGEMQEPISKEFRRAFEEQNLGIALEDALDNMTERVPNLDLRFFCTAVVLQRQTGGDLAEILDKIGHLIRERFKIWGAIQALTGEGRLSGIVLLALPPVLFITMYRLNPDYVMVLFNEPLGHKMLAAAVILQILGALVIRKIINIKV